MNILWDGTVCIEESGRRLYLDPKRKRPAAVVTHAHMDHLMEGAVMTPPTADIMRARLPKADFCPMQMPFGKNADIAGFDVMLSEAGHVLGSAMVNVGDVLYTGDFDTFTGITCGAAVPKKCEKLVVEATYGDPRFVLPDQATVVADMLSWMEDCLERGPVILGAYEFGKAQDLVALANSLRVPVVVPDQIASICDVYRQHGVLLDTIRLSEATPELLGSPHVLVTSRRELKHPAPEHIRALRKKGAASAYVSGWTAFWNFCSSHDIDAQFPFSNHADFTRIMDFVEACKPREVLTVHGSCESLSGEITKRLGIQARPLESHQER
jgi:putative mRNA 3-end processing factor